MYGKIISLLQLTFFVAVFLAIYGLYKFVSKSSPTVAIIVTVLLICLTVYMSSIEPNMLTLTHMDLNFQDYPLDRPIRILQLSDLHYDNNRIIYRKTLSAVKKEEPDIIVITGDFIGGKRNGKVIEFCKKIMEMEKPVYAVMGNWDHKYPNTNGLEEALSKLGITVLVNSNREVLPHFYIAGTDDPYFGYANLDDTFEGIPKNAFTVLLAHAPDIIYGAVKYKPRLILSGHTHGGQVKVPVIKAIYVPSKYGTRFLEGMYKIDSVYAYVNRGIGESHLPLRFLSPPEITVFTLHN